MDSQEENRTGLHDRRSELAYRLKVAGLQMRRGLTARPACHRFDRQDRAADLTICLETRSPIWTTDDPDEQGLEMGKVHNLRVAVRALNGITIPAGQVFSFWRHLGSPSPRRGYVAGRALVQGCIVPSIGGGLCQLTNALYELALQSSFEIVERHAHTQPVPRSTAKAGRDATIAWNYIDLRFRPVGACHIEAFLTRDELVVRYYTEREPRTETPKPRPSLTVLQPTANSCETCGESGCFRYGTQAAVSARSGRARTAYLLDGLWPEYQLRLQQEASQDDTCFVPTRSKLLTPVRYAWQLPVGVEVRTATRPAITRAIHARQHLSPPDRRAAQLNDTNLIAKRYAKQLRFDQTELVVDSSLLSALAETGELGGRSLTVWLTQVPLRLLHEHLDAAANIYPHHAKLADFRASKDEVERQWQVLESAKRVVTPHPYLAGLLRDLLNAEIELIPWVMPTAPKVPIENGGYVYFAGPTAAREGAIAMRDAARNLGIRLSIGGRNLEEPDFWDGCELLDPATHPMSRASVVVCGAVLKNRPSECLKAIAMGKPLIATPGCGVSADHIVPFGDSEGLSAALDTALSSQISP